MNNTPDVDEVVLNAALQAEQERPKGERFTYARILIIKKLRDYIGLKVANQISIRQLEELGYTKEDW